MTATGGTSGSVVNLQPCNGAQGQAWGALIVGTNTYELQSALDTNLCLTVQNNGTGNGTPVVAATCSGSADQAWLTE